MYYQDDSDYKLNNKDFDKKHIWHPYSSTTCNAYPFIIDSASGVRLVLENGEKIIDGMSSWWSVIHGYNNKYLNDALKIQIDKMSHVMFGGLTHKPAINLARKLVSITPKTLQTVFFADSGSVSVEIAIKMAIQYWHCKNKKEKNKLVTIRGGYHGDTTGAMSVCDPVTGMHNLFNNILIEQIFITKPMIEFTDNWNETDIDPLKNIIYQQKEKIAAVILEPIVQGAGGMRFYSPSYLKRAYQLCKENDILLIVDEIATGFGRTGKLFASEFANISPDIMCVGKALTGGYMTLAATLCTENISDTISNNGVFMHGPTFMANPLACSVANASIDLLFKNNWQQQIKSIENILKKALQPCMKLSNVHDVRVLGAIGVVELKTSVNMKQVQPLFVEHGVWIRPFGKLVYLMPPYIISSTDLLFLCSALFTVVKKSQHL